MVSGGTDQDPWTIMTEMTMNGCQDSEASASPAGNNSPKRPGKYPTNDLPPRTDDPNATSGTICHTLARDYKTNAGIPRGNQNFLKTSDLEELENTGSYKLHQGLPPGWPPFSMSSGCQLGSFPGKFPIQNVPRFVFNGVDLPTTASHSFSVLSNQSEAEVRQQDLTSRDHSQMGSQPNPPTSHLGRNNATKGSKKQRSSQKSTMPPKQYPQDMQNSPAGEYRQFDMNENTQDAETDEELAQDPELNEKSRHEN